MAIDRKTVRTGFQPIPVMSPNPAVPANTFEKINQQNAQDSLRREQKSGVKKPEDRACR
jgi:hypothetical protein